MVKEKIVDPQSTPPVADQVTLPAETAGEVHAKLQAALAQEQDLSAQLRDELELEQKKCTALEAEVESLTKHVHDLHEEAKALGAQLEKALKQKDKASTASSVVFETAPEVPATLDRPEVEIGGEKYRFTRGRIAIFGGAHLATDLAADESLCLRILQEYPQLLERV